MELINNNRTAFQKVIGVIILLAAIQLIVSLSPSLHSLKGLSGFIPIHTILETAAIIVSMTIFAVGWGVQKESQSSYSILLAFVFLGVGLLDLLHTLSYQGMPDFITPNSPEKAINFWLMARLLSALGLLTLTSSSWGRLTLGTGRLIVIIVVLMFIIFTSVITFKYPHLVPHTFILGQGLTTFKLWAEIFIIVLYITAAIRFFMQIGKLKAFDAVGLFGATSVMALSEIYFTLYANVTDVFMLLGHTYKVIAYGFIYKSIFLSSIKEPYRQIEESKNLLQTVIEHIPMRVFWKDLESRYLGCNTIFSIDAGELNPKEVVGKSDKQLGWRNEAELYRSDDLLVINSNKPKLNFEEPQTTPDGGNIWLRTSKVPLVSKDKEIIGVLGVYEDISEQKMLEQNLHLSYSAIENSKIAHFWISPEGQVTYANDFACKCLGYSREELVGMHVWDYDLHSLPSAQDQFWLDIKQDGIISIESRFKRKDGTVFPVEITSNYICSDNVEQVFCAVHDITKRKEAEDMIWLYANFDSLTGLPNRRMFQDRLAQEIKKAQRTKLPLALLFLDIDDFKEINDTLGHVKGDQLLMEAASRISACVRSSDTVARFGGDEFTILLSDIESTHDVARICLLILQKLSEPFHLDGEVAYASASIGVTFYPEDATEIDVLLKNADQAMYAAKASGRNSYSYFTPTLQALAQNRMKMANDLRDALQSNQLWVAYQPIIDLTSRKIVKAEALIRWQHPTLGLISPAEFIPVAEHTGLINEIGEFVFNQASANVKKWQALYHQDFQISINVSPVQLNDKNEKFKPWSQQLKQLGLSGKSIVVEITEGLLLEANASTQEKLLEFRDVGIQVALDDFGTGYSSLSYLKKLDIDYIKIDQSFVRNLSNKSEDLALCEAMIVMAHKLGLKVIAEGVETVEQRTLLADIECDFAQGYLISKPLSGEDFERLLISF